MKTRQERLTALIARAEEYQAEADRWEKSLWGQWVTAGDAAKMAWDAVEIAREHINTPINARKPNES